MATLKVYDGTGKEVGKYEIDVEQLAPKISKQLLHDACVMYQANRRMGTHRTKSRAEVSGHIKKLFRQKGTGNARMGNKRSPVRTGGGHGHAIRPRDYSYKMPKKAMKTATKMAIASKIADEQVMVVDGMSFDQPATKQMAGMLEAMGLKGQRALVATADRCVNAYKSGRNIAGVDVAPVADLNALTVIAPHAVVFTKEALDRVKDGTFNQQAKSEATESEA